MSLSVACCSIHPVSGQVDLSLRLSHVDPEAAKKQRKKEERKKDKKAKKSKLTEESLNTSDGENEEEKSTDSRYIQYVWIHTHITCISPIALTSVQC